MLAYSILFQLVCLQLSRFFVVFWSPGAPHTLPFEDLASNFTKIAIKYKLEKHVHLTCWSPFILSSKNVFVDILFWANVERVLQLVAIEGRAAAIPFDHHQLAQLHALKGGEAPTAIGADAPPPGEGRMRGDDNDNPDWPWSLDPMAFPP